MGREKVKDFTQDFKMVDLMVILYMLTLVFFFFLNDTTVALKTFLKKNSFDDN